MKRGWINPGVITAFVLLLGGAASVSAVKQYFKIYTRKDPIQSDLNLLVGSLPKATPSWVRLGQDHLEQEEVLAVLGTQNYLTRVYRERKPKNPDHPIVLSFHAAYYTGMIDTVPHVPDRCFVGGGMQIGDVVGDLPLTFDQELWSPNNDVPDSLKGRVWRTRITNPDSDHDGVRRTLPFNPQNMKLRTMKFLNNNGQQLYSGYFFIANGGTVCRAEEVRLLAFDLNTRFAYYLKVQVTSSDVKDGQELADLASSLIGEMLGDIMLCVPDWVEVEAGRYPPPPAPPAGPASP
ncbi:hypothetical protein PHYC_01691 [Phycisphaerales bacterium]|nr:hypothetical protein PHYC_01691 [Phycisphaerales bacterium]